jgi:hypothetical protein
MITENMDGLKKLLLFIGHLRSKNIRSDLANDRPDSVMVTFTVFGARVEVDFFEDHFEYSVFTGSEDVEGDEAKLFAIIDDFGRA